VAVVFFIRYRGGGGSQCSHSLSGQLHAAGEVHRFDVTMTKRTATCQASLSQVQLNSSYALRRRDSSYIAM